MQRVKISITAIQKLQLKEMGHHYIQKLPQLLLFMSLNIAITMMVIGHMIILQFEDCVDILQHLFPDFEFVFDHWNGHNWVQSNK